MNNNIKIKWLKSISECRGTLPVTLFDRTIATEILKDIQRPEVSERDICMKTRQWIKEGEHHYNMPNSTHTDKGAPGTVKNYIQCIGWVLRDFRVCLDRARAEIKGSVPHE
jgi:hypothetical protein